MRRGRPKEFDQREALERAMQLFWQSGYERTAVSDLLREMGISSQSLYDTFGDKRTLFIRSLEHYRDAHLSVGLDLLAREGSPVENVAALVRFFEELASGHRGCLVANAMVEMSPHDEEISRLLEEILGLLETAVRVSLERAQAQGEIGDDRSPRLLARAMVNAMIGLTVTGKLRPGAATLRDIYAGTISILR